MTIRFRTLFIVIVAASVLCDRAFADAPEQILMRDFYRAQDAAFQEHLVESYRRSRHTDAKWYEAMQRLAESAARTHHERHNRANAWQLDAQASRLIQDGCDTVAALVVRGIAQEDLQRSDDAVTIYDRLCKRLDGGEYLHPGIVCEIAARAGRLKSDRGKRDEATSLYSRAAEQFISLVQQMPRDVIQQRIMVNNLERMLRHDLPAEHGLKIVDALRNDVKFDVCTKETMAGIVQQRLAWEARGDGLADTVTDEGWEKFRKHSLLAKDHFERAFSADPSRPEAAAHMISIVRTQKDASNDTPKDWFERAVEAQVDWSPAYMYRLTFMQPQWGGSQEEMMASAKECVDSGRFDTAIPHRALDVVRAIIAASDGDHSVVRRSGIFPVVRTALEGLFNHPNHEANKEYYQAALFICSWAAGEYAYAKTRMITVDIFRNPASRDAFGDLLADPRLVRDQVVLYSSDAANDIRKAEGLLDQKQYGEASVQFERLYNQSPDGAVRHVLTDRLTTARLMSQFEKGEWVPIRFEAGLPGWQEVKPEWSIESDGSAVGMKHFFTGPMLISEMTVAPRYEVEVHIDMTRIKQSQWADAGIMFGFIGHPTIAFSQYVTVLPFAGKVGVGSRSGQVWRRDMVDLPIRDRMLFKLNLVVWDDVIRATIDDQQVFAGRPRGALEVLQPGRFGLGAIYDWPGDRVIYSGLRIRKLVEKPAFPSAQN